MWILSIFGPSWAQNTILPKKICNNKLCYKPYFFTLLYNFKVDKEGIKTKHDGQLICFEFISPIQLKELSVL